MRRGYPTEEEWRTTPGGRIRGACYSALSTHSAYFAHFTSSRDRQHRTAPQPSSDSKITSRRNSCIAHSDHLLIQPANSFQSSTAHALLQPMSHASILHDVVPISQLMVPPHATNKRFLASSKRRCYYPYRQRPRRRSPHPQPRSRGRGVRSKLQRHHSQVQLCCYQRMDFAARIYCIVHC